MIMYATALEMGSYPALVIPDTRTYFPNGEPSGTNTNDKTMNKNIWVYPDDYGQKPGNYVLPMRDDLADSFNIPAAKVMAFCQLPIMSIILLYGLLRMQQQAATCIKGKIAGWFWCCDMVSIEVPLIQMVSLSGFFADQGAHVCPTKCPGYLG